MGKQATLVLCLSMLSVLTEARHKPLPSGFFHSLPMGQLFLSHDDGSHGDSSHGDAYGNHGDSEVLPLGSGIMSGDGNHDNGHSGGSGIISGDGIHGEHSGGGILSGDGIHGEHSGGGILSGDGIHGEHSGGGILSGDGIHGEHSGGGILSGDGIHGEHSGGGILSGDGNYGNGHPDGSGVISGDHDNGFTGGMSGDHDNGFTGGMSGDSSNGSDYSGSHGDNMQAVDGIFGVDDLHGLGDHSDIFGEVSEDDDDFDSDFGQPHLPQPESEDDDDFDSDFGQPHLPQHACGKGCAKCDMFGLCRKCKKGYKVDQWGIDCIKKPKPAKKSCRYVDNCQKCPGASLFYRSCQRCNDGWFKLERTFSFTSKCVKKCPRSYQGKTTRFGPICEKIKPKCPLIRGCVKCTSRRTCVKCAKNLSVSNSWYGRSSCVRKCPRAYDSVIKNGVKICQLEEGCKDSYCSFCKDGWLEIVGKFSGRKCHKKCPSGFYQIGSNCLQCERGCKQCSSPTGQCTACKGRLALYKTTPPVSRTTCRARCPRGYTKTLVKGKGFVCQKACYVANCQSCPIDDHIGQYHHCDVCQQGYHLLHQMFDRCVERCPKGYFVEKTFIGTICRRGPRPTEQPTPETTTEPEHTSTAPEYTTSEPEITTPEPEQTTTEPEQTTTEPESTTPVNEFITPEPEQTTTELEQTTIEPEQTTIEPSTSPEIQADPIEKATTSEPERTTLEPSFMYNDEP